MPNANLSNEKFFLNLIKQGKIEVTKSGRAFNLITGRELAKGGKFLKNGKRAYRKVGWYDSTKTIHIQLHRLIWCYFKGIPDNPDLEINHIDGDVWNCKLSNLELIYHNGNMQHAYTTGLIDITKRRGENHGRAIFTNNEVLVLRKKFAKGFIDTSHIRNKFNVDRTTVSAMLSGRTFTNVKSRYTERCKNILDNCPSSGPYAACLSLLFLTS